MKPDDLEIASSRPEFCVHCGRRLVDVETPDRLFNRSTGARPTVVWRQCPRYPKNGFQAMFRGVHESFRRDNPWHGREWHF